MDGKSVFVIGAGASNEAKLPTGYELKKRIARLLDIRFELGNRQKSGDHLITYALYELVKQPDGRSGDINPYLYEAWHIRDALPQAISIDNFIDCQRGNEKLAICGKLAIVRSILEAEKSSILYIDKFARNPAIKYSSFEGTWYLPFFQLLTENCEKDDLEKRFNSIALIIFNYDRCLEQFLCGALQNYYKASENEAAELIKSISIYHPYGSVGSLPWPGVSDSMEFGAEPNANQLLQLTEKIKTFTEGTDPKSSDISEIKEHVCQANKLVFLGFAFHKLNMQLIAPEGCKRKSAKSAKCYASTFGISKSDQEVITEDIYNLYRTKINVNMADLTCNAFFSEFWRSLAF